MKTIIKLLKECENDEELLVAIIGLILAYAFIFFVFLEIHWMCGMMSPYLTTSILSISIKIRNVIDKFANDEKK